MALSEHSDYKYINIPEFIPLKSSHSLKKNMYPTFPLKTIAYHMFAIISALTHGLNSFMAGTVIVSRIEDFESKSLGELLENPLESLTPASFAVGSIFGICSFFVNYAQLLDYMPKLKNDLFSLKILTENISNNKKTAILLSAGFSLAAATINSIFAWDTYRSISSSTIRYPFAITASIVSFVITFAVRFVRTKEKAEENAHFYSPEEYFLLQLMKDLKTKHHQTLHRDEDLTRPLQETPYISHLANIFQQQNILILNRDELEETLAEIIKEKNLPPTLQKSFWNLAKILYVIACTFIGAEIFGEKAANKIPSINDQSWFWEGLRVIAGMGLSLSHIITYYVMASNIFDVIQQSFQSSVNKTLFGVSVNLGAAPSMVNYFFSVTANAHPPIKKNSFIEFIFAFIAFWTSFNLNYDSWANKFILPPPSPLEKNLQTLRQSIIEEKPVRNRTEYYHSIRTLKSAFFKANPEEKEKLGCWGRFRRFTGL